MIAFIDNSIITYGWRDTIGKVIFAAKIKKTFDAGAKLCYDETIRQGGGKAVMEIVLDVIQVVLAAILVVLVYKLYKKQ